MKNKIMLFIALLGILTSCEESHQAKNIQVDGNQEKLSDRTNSEKLSEKQQEKVFELSESITWEKATEIKAHVFLSELVDSATNNEALLKVEIEDSSNEFLLTAPDPNNTMYLGRITHTSKGYLFGKKNQDVPNVPMDFSGLLEQLNHAKKSFRVSSGDYLVEIAVSMEISLIEFHENVEAIKKIYPELQMILTLSR